MSSNQQIPQYAIPVRVFLTALDEYGASLHQWQLQAEAGHRENLGLRNTVTQLEREKEEFIQREEMQHRLIQAQRELIESLERDIADLNAARYAAVPITDSTAVAAVPVDELGVHVPIAPSTASSELSQSDETSRIKTLMSFNERAESATMGATKRKAEEGHESPSKRAETGTWC